MSKGMRIFASSATAHSLTNLSLFKNHPEIKQEIQASVQEALKHDTFILRPFRRTLHKSTEESQINRYLFKQSDVEVIYHTLIWTALTVTHGLFILEH